MREPTFVSSLSLDVHEVPSGVLADPATFAAELDEFVALVGDHGAADEYEPLLRHWRLHCAAWTDYPNRRAEFSGYADYLARSGNVFEQKTLGAPE